MKSLPRFVRGLFQSAYVVVIPLIVLSKEYTVVDLAVVAAAVDVVAVAALVVIIALGLRATWQ